MILADKKGLEGAATSLSRTAKEIKLAAMPSFIAGVRRDGISARRSCGWRQVCQLIGLSARAMRLDG